MITRNSLVEQTYSIYNANATSNHNFVSLVCFCLANSFNLSYPQSTFIVSSADKKINSNAIDYLSAFQVIFGINARQTSTSLFIPKSKSTLTPEGLLVFLFLQTLKFKEYSNEKIYSFIWGSSLANNKVNHTLLIYLTDKLTLVDTYEIPEIDNVIRISDY